MAKMLITNTITDFEIIKKKNPEVIKTEPSNIILVDAIFVRSKKPINGISKRKMSKPFSANSIPISNSVSFNLSELYNGMVVNN